VSKATVHAVISRDTRLGVAAIETPGKGGGDGNISRWKKRRNSSLLFSRKPSVGTSLRWGRSGTLYAQRIGHEVNDSTMYRLLHRHGWRKVMPRPRHPKSDLETQERFKKTDPSLVEAAVATKEAGDERPVLILAQDEGCFGRISQVKRAWAPPGMRPHVPVQVIREYMYVYAAVAPAQGQMVSLMLPETSTAMMNIELSHVSRSFPEHFIVMQVDQAGWHRSQELFIEAEYPVDPTACLQSRS